MTTRLPYSTIGGQVTRAECFAQLHDYLRLCQDCSQRMSTPHYRSEDYAALMTNLTLAEESANVLGHLLATEDSPSDRLLSHGWHGVAEMLHNNRLSLQHLATRPHINRWHRVQKMFETIAWHVKKMHEAKLN
jgi:hypothetical protein